MKNKIVSFFIIFILTQVDVSAQQNLRLKYNTVQRKNDLFTTPFARSFSGSFSSGNLFFGGELNVFNQEQSTTKNISINKRINEGLFLCTQVSFGSLYGKASDYEYYYGYLAETDFFNDFLSYSLLAKKRLTKKNEQSLTDFQINAGMGLGVIASKVELHYQHNALNNDQLNHRKLFLPISLDCSYFFTKHLGIFAATEFNYCFTDKIDLTGTDFDSISKITQLDYFSGYRFGFCVKLE